MSNHGPVSRAFASLLVLLTVLTTTPVHAAELAHPARSVVGSVSAVGPVQLRGIAVTGEGTVFSGDRIRSQNGAYAKVRLSGGDRLELGADTEITVSQEASVVKLALASGNVAFNVSGSPLHIAIAPYEVTSTNGAGNVAVMGADTVGVRSRTGSVRIHNTRSRETFVIEAGEERLLGRSNDTAGLPITQIASTLPAPLPSSAPSAAPSAPRQGATGLSTAAWVTILAAVAGGTAVGAFFAGRAGTVDEEELDTANTRIGTLNSQVNTLNGQVNTLNGQVSSLNTQIAGLEDENSDLAKKLVSVRNAAAVQLSGLQAELTAAQIALKAEQTKSAILSATIESGTKDTLSTQATALVTKVETAQVQTKQVNTQISNVKAELETLDISQLQIDAAVKGAHIPVPSGAGPRFTALIQQLNDLEHQLEELRETINTALNELNTLIQDAQDGGVSDVPVVDIDPVGDPTIVPASASIPV